MNSFTDGKPIEQTQPAARPTVVSVAPKATPRYGLFGFLIILGLLAYLIYDLQAAKKQIKESQAALVTAKNEFAERFNKNDESLQAFRGDFNVVRQRLGVTQRELDQARAYSQQMKAEH